MLITNRFNIPEPFLNFANRDKYDSGDADISVTSLIDSSRIRKLKEKNEDNIEEDISERIMSILGTAVHNILEVGCPDNSIAERRFFFKNQIRKGLVWSGRFNREE